MKIALLSLVFMYVGASLMGLIFEQPIMEWKRFYKSFLDSIRYYWTKPERFVLKFLFVIIFLPIFTFLLFLRSLSFLPLLIYDELRLWARGRLAKTS